MLCLAGSTTTRFSKDGPSPNPKEEDGEFGKGVELPYFMGQLQSEPNFDLAFGDKEAYWVMANGLYFKQWDPGGNFFFIFIFCAVGQL